MEALEREPSMKEKLIEAFKKHKPISPTAVEVEEESIIGLLRPNNQNPIYSIMFIVKGVPIENITITEPEYSELAKEHAPRFEEYKASLLAKL